MHPIDAAIYDGTLTPDLLAEYAAKPLPVPGVSYWGDNVLAGKSPSAAARLAARQMGSALASLASL